jgi:thiol:disulfide interchange protein DsbD
VLFLLGLNFSGLLELGTRFMGVGESLVQRGGYVGSFFTGALAAVVASPCTAPFMGSAIAFAIIQPPLSSLLIFMSLAFGMALPFLLIAFVPRFADFLPRPGPWMHTFKQVMAFPLYLTAIWLLWVLGRQTDATGMALVLIGMLLLFFAIWLLQIKPPPQGRWRPFTVSLAITAKLGALVVLLLPELSVTDQNDRMAKTVEDSFWEPYSSERLADLRAQGRPVFVNITADWCISCIANERVALSLDVVRQSFKDKGVVSLKGDWTNRRPHITRVLESFGRSGVPLYVLYPPQPNAEPLVLPQWLTPMNVMETLDRI